jgi:hypothetical protein
MAAHQLVVAVVGHLREVAGAPLLEQQREEVHLEEHVAQLVQELGVVARVRGVGQLVGLLHGVRDDGPLVLLTVPRAFAPQAPRQGVEAGDRGGDGAGLGHRPSLRRRRARSQLAGWVCGLRRRRRGRRLLLRRVVAVLRHVGVAALRLVLPALAVVLAEGLQRLALVLLRQDLLDRRGGLAQRLLVLRRDLLDLEDVVAELRLDGPDGLALVGLEDRRVERLLLGALGDAGQLAAAVLGLLVDRVLLGDLAPRLAAGQCGLGGVRVGLGLRQDDPQVAALRLGEARLVLVVVLADLGVGDLVLALGDLLRDLLLEQLAALLVEDVGVRQARSASGTAGRPSRCPGSSWRRRASSGRPCR